MIPLHCSSYPEGHLPKTPEGFLADWHRRSGLRNDFTTDALNLLERLGTDKVMVCENAKDSTLPGLKWSIYQDPKNPEFFIVIGKLGVTEFATIQYLPERMPVLDRERFTYQRLNQFHAVTSNMKENFLGIKEN